MLRVYMIPPETARCFICGPNPELIVIDRQALGCTDPGHVHPARDDAECPVLDISASNLCVLESAALRAAICKVLRLSTPLTDTKLKLAQKWHLGMKTREQATVKGGAANLFLQFFPVDGGLPIVRGGEHSSNKAVQEPKQPSTVAASADLEPSPRRKRKAAGSGQPLEDALRLDEDGVVTIGRKGPAATKPIETWRDRSGLCAQCFKDIHRDDDGAWLAVLPVSQALLAETVSGMLHGHDESALRPAAHSLRLKGAGAWREITMPLKGVGLVPSFMGRFVDLIDMDARSRVALGQLLVQAVDVERSNDGMCSKAAHSAESRSRGCMMRSTAGSGAVPRRQVTTSGGVHCTRAPPMTTRMTLSPAPSASPACHGCARASRTRTPPSGGWATADRTGTRPT